MSTITVKLQKISQDQEGATYVTVELNDSKGKWQKTYTYYTNEVIKLNHIKERVEEDIKRDLKVNRSLEEIKSKVGETWTVTLDKSNKIVENKNIE